MPGEIGLKMSRHVSLIGIGLLLAAPCGAHHFVGANFDQDTIISIDGVITEFKFVNPHTRIRVEVATEDGASELWLVELNAKNQLLRAGQWTEDQFEPGQVVTMYGWKGYRERSMFMRWAVMADGTEIRQPGVAR